MRIVFNPNENRKMSRDQSLSKRPLVIADDVNPTDDVEMKFLDDYISIERTGKEGDIAGDEEWLYVGRSFGVYGKSKGLSSVTEVVICDECVAIKLMKGALAIHLDESKPEDVVIVSTGIDESTLPTPYLNSIKWVDRDNFLSLCTYWGDLTKDYPSDYMFKTILAGDGGVTTGFSATKMGLLDISYGELAIKEERLIELERKKKLKAATGLLSASSKPTRFETFDTDMFPEDEEEDDDDDMYNY